MDLISLKETLTTGRELFLHIGEFLSKYIPFPSENISLFLVLILSFWIISTVYYFIPGLKDKLLIKLASTGALFYLLWLW
jgi:ATP/ADP translocase